MNPNRNYHFETLQLHAGQEQPDPYTGARAVPIYQTAAYVFDDAQDAADRFALRTPGNIYSRLTNPTVTALEARIVALEGGTAALALASGAAAITYALQNLTQAGDHIVAQRTIYGGSYNLLAHTLPRAGVTTTFVDPLTQSYEDAIQDNTRLIFVETLSNPNSDVTDLRAVAEIAHRHGIPLVVDNTFATPYLVRPISYGADIVIHSATKFLGGHGTTLGGVIVEGGKFHWTDKFPQMSQPDDSYHGVCFAKACGTAAFCTRVRAVLLRDTGAVLSPFDAFLLLQGLETLSLRVERHVENALRIVQFLNNHPAVACVNHPSLLDCPTHALYQQYFPKGGGSIFTVELHGGTQAAHRFIDRLEVFSLLANVADAKSLVIHPASTTHAQLNQQELEAAGIRPGTVRLSIGLEHIDDLLDDLKQALAI